MPDWVRRDKGLPVHQASTLSWLPGITQGFTTRAGGASSPPFDTFNLGTNTDDSPDTVRANRHALWGYLHRREEQVALAEQVHGTEVAAVTHGGPPVPGADALVTDTPGVLLMLCFADCVPVYIVDPVGRAIGLAHAGWQGVAGGIVPKTANAMREQFGSRAFACLAAVGPCIGGESYEVGVDVADRFRALPGLRAASAVLPRNEWTGTYTVNLRQIVYAQLLDAGFRADYVAVSDEDTFRNRAEFYSYRRDGVRTGRMAAFLGMREI